MTISEIAKLADVSPAAVSRYLNNGYLSEDKKERIRQVIEETGYQPSVQAQMLRSKKSKLLGLVVPSLDNESTTKIITVASRLLQEQGYDILIHITDNDSAKELLAINKLINRVDGILLIAGSLSTENKDAFKNSTVPIVVVGLNIPHVNCVYFEDQKASKELTTYMIKSGKRKIAYLGLNPKSEATGAARYDGYRQALGDNSVTLDPKLIRIVSDSMEAGYECVKDLLLKVAGLDGIFCATDAIAAGALEYIEEKVKTIKSNILIAAIRQSPISDALKDSLITAAYHYEESGKLAAELLITRCNNPKETPVQIPVSYSCFY